MPRKSLQCTVKTPAYIFDEATLKVSLKKASEVCKSAGLSQLFPMKSMSVGPILEIVKDYVDGFAVSSLFEARLASAIRNPGQAIHFTSPGLRRDEIDELCDLCNGFACNSLHQLQLVNGQCNAKNIGLRINPQLSFVEDERFDPCRRHSKLGVPVQELKALGLKMIISSYGDFSGIHFHTNSESETFAPLLKTVLALDATIPEILEHIQWINFGGGYYFEESDDEYYKPLIDAATFVQEKYGLKVHIEPGLGVACSSGTLISTVIDAFEREGRWVAIMDTTVNHFPEVLEFEYKPTIEESIENRDNTCIVSGCSCLAGDIFGDYGFDNLPQIGDQLTFLDAGTYTMVKAHMFNGINIPDIYLKSPDNGLTLIREFTYNDYFFKHGEIPTCD